MAEIRKHARGARSSAPEGRPVHTSAVMLGLGGIVVAVAAVVGALGPWRSGDVPDVASVTCSSTGPMLANPLVRPQPDGVHLAFENPAGAGQFDVHAARWSEGSSIGGDLGPGVTRTQISAPPGMLLVTCLGDHGFTWGRPARVTVVDPGGLWVSPRPSCSDLRVHDVDAGTPPDEPAPAQVARSTLGGLRSSDLVLKPGYPQSRWQGNLVVVVRQGHTIAAITQYADQARWIVHVQACPGSRLLSPA